MQMQFHTVALYILTGTPMHDCCLELCLSADGGKSHPFNALLSGYSVFFGALVAAGV